MQPNLAPTDQLGGSLGGLGVEPSGLVGRIRLAPHPIVNIEVGDDRLGLAGSGRRMWASGPRKPGARGGGLRSDGVDQVLGAELIADGREVGGSQGPLETTEFGVFGQERGNSPAEFLAPASVASVATEAVEPA